jgi:nucleotide-binding universal stress UspA family protein
MIRSILVLVDGSAFSAQAIPCAVGAAHAWSANLEFVQVHIPAYPSQWLEGLAQGDLRWEDETRQQEREDLERVAARVTAEWGIAASCALLEGELFGTILRHASETNAVMIVLATHGRSGFKRVCLGSVAERLIPLSHVPILLVHPPQHSAPTPDVELFQHILIPLDGSPLSETVIPFALALGGTSAKYTLTRIVQSADVLAVSPPMLAALRDPHDSRKDQLAMDDLVRIADELEASGYDANIFMEAHPRPARAIMQHAYDCGADAIAISTHGRHGLSRLALGTVTDELLREFQKPVLVYRPHLEGPPEHPARTAEMRMA